MLKSLISHLRNDSRGAQWVEGGKIGQGLLATCPAPARIGIVRKQHWVPYSLSSARRAEVGKISMAFAIHSIDGRKREIGDMSALADPVLQLYTIPHRFPFTATVRLKLSHSELVLWNM